jgi:hypothetical protein
MKSYFQVFDFDTSLYRFSEWAINVLHVDDIADLHRRADLSSIPVYDAMDICREQLLEGFAECRPILVQFYKEQLLENLGIADEAFQCPPTFRVHLPKCPTVSAFHRDMDYGMQTDHLCLWVPLSRVWDSNSLWVEFGEDNPRPINLVYGQYIIFDSATLRHGSVKNDTMASRVSFDSRFKLNDPYKLPPRDWGTTT